MLISNNLKKEVLEKIKPSLLEQENLSNFVSSFIKKLEKSSNKLDLKCSYFIGGSFGKDTFLKTSSDVDIFVRFDSSYEDDKLSFYLEKILLNAKLKPKKQKGSRDYFSLKYTSKKIKMIFELIPNQLITNIDDAKNSTDLSPLHVDFLKFKFKENPNLTDEIRLTKQFFKSKNLYGAESYINGFSGHSIDILIAYYGSFEKLILAGKNWNEQEIIDINNFYTSKEEILNNLNSEKISNLILVDPIIKSRNAGRALSNDKYCEFILLCNNISNLSINDFIVKKIDISQIILESKTYAKNNNLKYLSYKFKFKISDESEDIVGSKLLKLEKKFIKYFESLDFKFFLDDFHIDIENGVCLFIFLFEKIDLPKIKKVLGPKVFMKQATSNFLKNRDYYFIEDSRVCIYEPRIIYNLNDVSKIDLSQCQKMLNKDISFISSIKINLN